MNESVATVNWHIERGLHHSIHTSGRRSFRGCRRRWNWAYREKIYPKTTVAPLEFGVAFHAAMEVLYEPAMWGRDPETQLYLAITKFNRVCDDQLKKYRKLNGDPSFEVLEDFKERRELGNGMLRHYVEFVSPRYDKGFKPVRVEVPFEVPILGPSREIIWCKCEDCWNRLIKYEKSVRSDLSNLMEVLLSNRSRWQGLPVTYGGRLDMLAQDSDDRLWIFDWKTTSRLFDGGSEESTLDLDDQISSYVWALKTYYNLNVAGFVYVEIRKAWPQPPEPLTRLYKGRAYSTSKTFFTTYEIASQFLSTHDTDAFALGAYDEYLLWLRNEGPRFHQRHQIHKNDYELGQIGLNIYYEALDIIENPRIYPQPGRFSCRNCAYQQPCLGMNQGEDYTYTLNTLFDRHEKLYYEEQPATTD